MFSTDASSVNDAVEEATLDAKARLAEFLNQELSKDSSVDKVVLEKVKITGKQRDVSKEQQTLRLKSLHSHAQAILKGVAVLGDCYTKGEEVRVAVGVKENTIAAAEKLSAAMSSPPPKAQSQEDLASTKANSPVTDSSASSNILSEPKGFSDTTRLKKF